MTKKKEYPRAKTQRRKEEPLPLRNLLQKLKKAGRKCTVLGVGPVSLVVVRATFEACRRYDCPAIFIASRNQVDLKSLGHGYLMGGMDQAAFVDLLKETQAAVGFDGPLYICRDHGGPWQRNAELDGKYPLPRAMDIARQSFYADIEAGFNYLHIDPTKCPFPFSQDDLCSWTVELLKYCEGARKALGKPPIDYEVGTEDIQGGLTTNETFDSFLEKVTCSLQEQNLPLPTCIVGQTGTLCRMDRNVGCFDKERAAALVQIAAKYGIGLKEHNGDYLDADACRAHPEIGIAGMNVAPEFGLVETDACLHLADLETELVKNKRLSPNAASNLRELLLRLTLGQSPWKKWMSEDIKQRPVSEIESDGTVRLLIARVCGHYVYDVPEVVDARKRLYRNIDESGLPDGAERFVVSRVRDAIEFYQGHL